jgi:hypothetical protein
LLVSALVPYSLTAITDEYNAEILITGKIENINLKPSYMEYLMLIISRAGKNSKYKLCNRIAFMFVT